MAKNDWIVAGLNNPDFTNSDFVNIADMTVDNTQLLSRDEYLKSNFIKNNPIFADANGKFSEEKFDQYYQKRVKDFGEFQDAEFSKGPALDMFDIDRTKDTPIQDVRFNIGRGVNPDRQAIGIEGVNVWSDPVFSRREIAKQNKVFNTATGKYEDYSVNDHTLVTSPLEWIKDLWKDPLVLATWDEDGTHIDEMTGMVREHKKGDAKLNNKGTYYYETLGGRSIIGKDVLSTFDTLTVDGEGINKYDFFDSNDIEKSVSGTIAKNVVALLPLFCGPVVGGIYSAAMIGREFSKSLPMLYGMVTAFSDSEAPSWINSLAAIGQRATTSTSDYAGENTFSFENFGNLVSDVALQWGQQKMIAQAVTKFRGAPNYLKEAEDNARALYAAKSATLGESPELWTVCMNRYLPKAQELATKSSQLGRDMSLAYMAIVSNTDVYSDALEHGTTKAEAAAIALGSTLGMFAVDKYAHLGELFFDEATPNATKMARQALKDEFKTARSVFDNIKSADMPEKHKLVQYIKTAADTSKRVLNRFSEDLKYHTTNLAEKMIGEGLEEVGEELVADTSKGLYELAGKFGFDTTVKDVGAWDNAFERYAMSFMGGAIGGGVFYGKEVWDGKSFHKPKLDEDIATLIRNGHVDELRKQLAVMAKEGKTGSKTLSTEAEITDDGKKVWRTTDDESQSQSQAVINMVTNRINNIEEILLANRVNLSDDELFNNMVLSEKRYTRYKNVAPLVNYYQDFATVLNGLINAEMTYKRASDTLEGTKDGNPIPNDTALNKLTPEQKASREANLEAIKQQADAARQQVRDFLSGNNSLDYVRKLNFAMDPELHEPFLELDQEAYLQSKYPGKTFDQLSEAEMIQFAAVDWPQYVNTQLKDKLSIAWDKFKQLGATVDPHLGAMEASVPAYKQWVQQMETLMTSGILSDAHASEEFKKYIRSFDVQLEGETDEEFQNRNKKKTDPETGEAETDDDFKSRVSERMAKIIEYNNSIDKAWADQITAELQKVDFKVDPITALNLRRTVANVARKRDVLKRFVGLYEDKILNPILVELNPDLSNLDEVKSAVEKAIKLTMADKTSTEAQLLQEIDKLNVAFDNGSGTETQPFRNLFDFEIINPEDWNETDWAGSLTLQEIFDANGNLSPDLFLDLTEADYDTVNRIFQEIAKVLPEETQLQNIETALNKKLEDQSSQLQGLIDMKLNQVDSIVAQYKESPLIKLQDSLQETIINPVGELLKQVAASNNDTIGNVDEILKTLQGEFDSISDAARLWINDAQRAEMEKAMNYMKMLKVYMTAASTVPNTLNPVGHNKTINAFAESHKDKLITPWEKLPELDSDYVAHYKLILDQYIDTMEKWLQLSDRNAANKITRFVATDKALNKALYNVLSSVSRNFTINEKQYDLLEGIDGLDIAQLDTEYSQVPLYNLERLLYSNVRKIAKDQNMTVSELVQNTNLLETLIQGLPTLSAQRASQITDKTTAQNITDFDKLQYIATILSSDPARFFTQLKGRVNADQKIAPISTQELTTRIAQASMTQTFRDILKHAQQTSQFQHLPILTNTTIIFGVAGAGKTQVVLNSIDSTIKDQPAIIAGPTMEQANLMKKAMGRTTAKSFEDLLIEILGAEQYKEIQKEFDDASGTAHDGKFFTINENKDGLVVAKIKADQVQFKTLEKAPRAIYLDEATHLTSVQAQLIDLYAQSIGAQVFMCGDPAQLGYRSVKNGVQNIDEGAVFAARTPRLTISLRDNNLQKFQNQETVRQLLEQVMESRLYDSEEEYERMFPMISNIMSKFNFRLYNKEEINGDMITKQLDDATISKLKAAQQAGKSIAFISSGGEHSPIAQKMMQAGITIPKENFHSLKTMQGQEYDIVVTDYNFTKPAETTDAFTFLRTLYTLMTRAREAAIFVDGQDLQATIGQNVISPYKAKAPSIETGVADLRAQKLSVLDKLDLSRIDGDEEAKPAETKPVVNIDEDFVNPEDRKTESSEAAKEAFTAIAAEEVEDFTGELPVTQVNPDVLGDFPIECYGDAAFLTVTLGEAEERENSKGQPYTVRSWTIQVPEGDSVLRNLQAITPKETTYTTYMQKIEAQKALAKVRSLCLFDHKWPTAVNPTALPKEITDNFTQKDWEAGSYELEFRQVSDTDVLPLHSAFKEVGMEYNGKKFIANIVFKVVNKRGRLCKIDVAGINNPKTLIDNALKIKANLEAKIAKLQGKPGMESTIEKLQKMHDSVDSSAVAYRNWFDEQLAKLGDSESYSIDVSNAVRKPQTTWFRGRNKQKIRLGGKINPARINETDVNNLKDQNPDKVFSPIYTFTGNEADFYNLDQSLSGKAVVFVTSDALMKPEELLPAYLAQKNNPSDNSPKVRMLMLDSYGASFEQLLDDEFMQKVTEGNEGRKPFRQNFVGLRMFTSLWNSRAALIHFNRALDKWMGENDYSEAKLNALLQAQDLLYISTTPNAKGDEQDKAKSIMTQAGMTDADLAKLDEFNNTTLLNTPMFRLGHARTKRGIHIESKEIKGSTAYDDGTVRLCYITPAKAKQYLGMVSAIVRSICPGSEASQAVRANSLDLALTYENKKGEKVEWAADEFIDLKNSGKRRSLHGLLSKQADTMIISDRESGNQLAYTEGDYWAVIPRLISNFVRTVYYYQNNPEGSFDQNLYANVTFKTNKGHEATNETKKLEIPIQEFFGQNGWLQATTNGTADGSLYDMMNLIFHGTTDDIKKNMLTDGQLLKMTDALFPNGFLTSPDISHKKESSGSMEIRGYSNAAGQQIFFEIATSDALFEVDVDLRSASLQLSLPELLGIEVQTATTTETETGPVKSPEEIYKETYPVEAQIIQAVNEDGNSFEFSANGFDEAVELYNNTKKNSLISLFGTKPAEEVLKRSFGYENGKIITFNDKILSRFPQGIVTIENGNVKVTTADGKVYQLDKETLDFTLVSNSAPSAVSISRMEDKFGSKDTTVGEAVIELLSSDTFRQQVLSDMEPEGWTQEKVDEKVNALAMALQEAISLGKNLTDTEDALVNRLAEISNDENHTDVLVSLSIANEDLYNIIFNNC